MVRGGYVAHRRPAAIIEELAILKNLRGAVSPSLVGGYMNKRKKEIFDQALLTFVELPVPTLTA